MPEVPLQVGVRKLSLKIADGKLVQGRRGPFPSRLGDLRLAAAASLEAPIDFPTFRQALTPDDHLVIVLQEQVNGLVDVLTAVLQHIHSAGVQMNQITVLVRPQPAGFLRNWVEQLPQECQGFQLEEHSPAQSKMAYLASTRAGRRIYLNRHIVDADQLIIIGKARFDPFYGVAIGLADVFPAFSDAPTLQELTRHLHEAVPAQDRPFPLWKETEEVGWQLGMPFVVCVVEGHDDAVSQVLAGSTGSVRSQAESLLRQHNIIHAPYQVDLLIGTLGGATNQQSFSLVVEALFRASQAVHQGGSVAILSEAGGILPAGADLVSQADSAIAALSQLRQHPEIDRLPWWYLARALEQCKAYLSSNLKQDLVESLFIIPLDDHRQVQNLIDHAKSVMLVEGVDRCLIELDRPAH